MSEPPTLFLDGRVSLYAGDCLEVLKTLADDSIDAVVTDPPYHLTSIVKRFGKSNLERDDSNLMSSKRGGSSPYKRSAAVFLDPPYRAYEALYGASAPVADQVAKWAAENADLRIAICGHVGDYDLPDWDAVQWSRGRLTYAGGKTTDSECIWYSPACLPAVKDQGSLFDALAL